AVGPRGRAEGGRTKGRSPPRSGGAAAGGNPLSRQPRDPPPRPGGSLRPSDGWPRWIVWVLIGLLAAVLVLPALFAPARRDRIDYGSFIDKVAAGQVASVKISNESGHIT